MKEGDTLGKSWICVLVNVYICVSAGMCIQGHVYEDNTKEFSQSYNTNL